MAGSLEEVEGWMQMAEQALLAAGALQEDGFYRDAVSRSYYAMFYAAKAALALQDIHVHKHSAVIAAFGRHLANAGLVPRRLHRTYDFGDFWEHTVELEKVMPRDRSAKYPMCIAGKRACPPEDCGGIWGYQDFLEIISDPAHEEHEQTLTWAGGGFDPECFKPEDLRFDDPAKRFKIAFS